MMASKRFFKLLLRLWLLTACCLFCNSVKPDLYKLVKYKVHPSSWVVDITMRNVFSIIQCATLCIKNNHCSALTYSNGDCNMGSGGITKRVSVPPYVEVFLIPGHYKIAVVGGDVNCGHGGGLLNSVNVYDMSNPKSTCSPLPNLDLAVAGHVGGIDYNHRPFYCGGFAGVVSSKCFVLSTTTGNWLPTANLIKGRRYAAMARNPFSDFPLYFVGGAFISNDGNTAEYFTKTGWVDPVNNFRMQLSLLCACFLNETTVIFVGGSPNGNSPGLRNTFLWNTITLQVTDGPQLLSLVWQQVCGRILKGPNGDDFTIIVAGGSINGLTTTEVEVFDFQLNKWKLGNQLPLDLCKSSLVEDPMGGVIIFGGASSPNSAQDTIYRLANADAATKWELLAFKLPIKMCYSAAFIIPDIYTNCTAT